MPSNIVLASLTPTIGDSKVTYTEVSCTECAHVALLQSNIPEPFCPSCGASDLDREVSTVSKDLRNEELSSIKCPGCSTHLIMEDAHAIEHDGRINCIACGEEVSFVVPELTADNDNDTQIDQAFAGLAHVVADVIAPTPKPTAPSAKIVESASIVSSLSKSIPIRLIKDGGYTYALKGNVQVATTRTDTNPFLAVLQDNPKALEALAIQITEAASSGIADKVLEGYGFAPLTFKWSRTQQLQEAADVTASEELAALKEAVAVEKEELLDYFMQSLSIAIAGTEKGFFSEDNKLSLHDIVTSGLREANIADSVTASVMKSIVADLTGYQKSIIGDTRILVETEVAARNSIATAVASAPYKTVVEDDGTVADALASLTQAVPAPQRNGLVTTKPLTVRELAAQTPFNLRKGKANA